MGRSHIHSVVVKNKEEYLGCQSPPWGVRGLSPILGSPILSTAVGKSSTHNFWLWKSEEIVADWDWRLLESQAFILKGLCTDSFVLIHFELQHWGSSSKRARDILEGKLLAPFYSFVKPSLYTACRHRWELSLSLSTWLTPFILPWLFPEILPQLVSPPNPHLVAFPEGLSNLLLWTLLKPFKVLQTQTSSIWPQCVTYLLLSGP